MRCPTASCCPTVQTLQYHRSAYMRHLKHARLSSVEALLAAVQVTMVSGLLSIPQPMYAVHGLMALPKGPEVAACCIVVGVEAWSCTMHAIGCWLLICACLRAAAVEAVDVVWVRNSRLLG
jgi:hypothetical protein